MKYIVLLVFLMSTSILGYDIYTGETLNIKNNISNFGKPKNGCFYDCLTAEEEFKIINTYNKIKNLEQAEIYKMQTLTMIQKRIDNANNSDKENLIAMYNKLASDLNIGNY